MTAPASSAAIPEPARHKHARHLDGGRPDPKVVLLLASGAVFISTLDLTVVNIAFPDLRADFPSASLPTLSWVVTAYGVMFAALLAAAGRVGDVVGRQRLFVWSVAAFTVTSLLATMAPNEGYLIFFRALQGVAAAGMSPTALGLILTWTPPERIMVALGVWGGTASVAAAIGPPVGGVLVDAWGWRAIFVINVPFGLAILYGALTRLSRDMPEGRRLPDLVGTAFLAVGVGAVVLGLSQGSQWGWTSREVLVSLTGGVLSVGAGLARSVRHPVPALELDLWRDRRFTIANTAAVFINATAYASLLSGTLFMTVLWNYSALDAGLALTPAAFAGAIGAVIAGKLATNPAAQRAVAVGGCLLASAGSLFLWAELGAEEQYLSVYLPSSLLTGACFGATFTALFGTAASSIPPSRFASGSGVLTMAGQLGGVLGVAAMAAVLAAPGYSSPVDPFLAVYLFCTAVALAGAVVSAGLPGRSPAPVAARGAADSIRRRRGVVAMAALVALAGVGMYSVSAGTDADSDGDGAPTAAASAAASAVTAPSTATAAVTASRSLALIDVSASMGEPAGAQASWLRATTQAVAAGVGPAPETTEVGVWVFGSRLRDQLDWAELLPVGPLDVRVGEATRRQLIQSLLGGVGSVPDDSLGLYDSVLAAFRAMNNTYTPGMHNAVVVFTDGTDDSAGTALEGLLTTLGDEYDPTQPVHINIISYGDGVDQGALSRVAQATQGGTYAATSPQQAEEFFVETTSPRG